MTFFSRTAQGQLAAYDADVDLTHKMRALLKVVDGQTSIETYEQKLSAFGDVRGMLDSLQMAGFVQPVAVPASSVASVPSSRSALNPVVAAKATDEWAETCDGYAQTMRQPSPSNQRDDPETIALTQSADMRHKLRSQNALQAAKQLMARFTQAHLPDQSSEILEQLNQINDLEMLAVMLSGYESIVSPIGAFATEHLFDIKRILYQNL